MEALIFHVIKTRLADARRDDMPVHVGIPPGVWRVDVQLIVPRAGRRTPVWTRGVDPDAWHGKALQIHAGK